MRQSHADIAGHDSGFTLVELLVSLAITGIFLLMITGLVQTTAQLAVKQQSITERRSDTRFSIELVTSELAGVGGRLPRIPPFDVAGTVNASADATIADLGTDTFTAMRSRAGSRTLIVAQTGDMVNGTIRVLFHHEDTDGENAVCDTAQNCSEAFTAEYGDLDNYLAIGTDELLWVVRITATPSATLGAGGGINVNFEGVWDNTGGAAFAIGDMVTGLAVSSYRVFDETLQMKRDFLNGPGTFLTLANRIEDLQLAYILADGTYVNDGLPADPQSIRGMVVSFVGVAPTDRSMGGAPFNRPEVEDHAAGTVFDRRRRSVTRQIVWGRNLG